MNPEFFRKNLGVEISQKQIDSLAAGNTHPEVLNIKQDQEWIRGKIRLDVNPEGHIEVKISEVKEKLDIPESLGSMIISDKGKAILERGLPIPGPKGYAVVVDQEKNVVKAVPYKDMGIPSAVGGTKLSDKEKFQLMSGKEIGIKGKITNPAGSTVEIDLLVKWDAGSKSISVKNEEKKLGLSNKQKEILNFTPSFRDRILNGGKLKLAEKYVESLGHTGNDIKEKAKQIVAELSPKGSKISLEEFKDGLGKRMLESNIKAHALKIAIDEKPTSGDERKTVINSVGKGEYDKNKGAGKVVRMGEKVIGASKELSSTLTAGMG